MVGVLTLATASAFDLTMIGEFIVGAWVGASTYVEQVIRFLFTWGKELIGLLGGAYGILKWWYYREAVLHKRLETYLEREDARLKNARRDVLYTLARPGDYRKFAEPKFAVEPLRKILRRRRLDSRWSWQLPESTADRVLTDALRQIGKQSEVLEKAQQNYREQAVTAHVLKGVVAALRAQRSTSKESGYRTDALREFQIALAIPGKDHRLFALEQIAHQLRGLSMLDAAAEAYTTLLSEIDSQLTGKSKELANARALRWRALVHQAIRYQDATPGCGALRAWGGVNAPAIKAAIESLSSCAPLREWEAIELGDTLYAGAFIGRNLGYTEKESDFLTAANTAYASVDIWPKRSLWRMRGKERMLAKAARAGVKMVEAAQSQGTYDFAWLLPPGTPLREQARVSDAPQNPTQAISGGGSQEGVPQAP